MRFIFKTYQCRIVLFCCLTVVGLTYCILHSWLFEVLSRKHPKDTSHLNSFFDIQDILFNSLEYDDIFSRDPNVRCKFPMANPLDKHAMKDYQKKTIKCVYPDDDRAVIDHTGGLSMKPEMLGRNESCFFSEITRPFLEDKAYSSLKAPLVGTIYPRSDFINIECTDKNDKIIFADYLAHVQRLPHIKAHSNSDEYSVAVIGIGSMSRLSFMKQMPRSYNYVKNRLGSTEMLGFATAESTTPYQNIMEVVRGNEGFVSSKFIWDHFSDVGAVTLYAEDWPNMLMFTTRGLPVKRQPAHHYGNTFWAAIEGSQIVERSQKHCFGKRPYHLLHFNYLLSFMRTYQNSSSFLFSLYNELTMNDVNMAQVMDDDFVEFLKTMVREDLLNRTILMVLGIHGHGTPEMTEGWMPLVSIILPQSAPLQWKQALKVNRKRLTSTYDLYQTFVDILGTRKISKSKIQLLKKIGAGTSLFTEITRNRTCQDVFLVNRWCPCQETLT